MILSPRLRSFWHWFAIWRARARNRELASSSGVLPSPFLVIFVCVWLSSESRGLVLARFRSSTSVSMACTVTAEIDPRRARDAYLSICLGKILRSREFPFVRRDPERVPSSFPFSPERRFSSELFSEASPILRESHASELRSSSSFKSRSKEPPLSTSAAA